MGKQDDFDIANRAFVLMTLAERERVLEDFAGLRYPSIIDRFFDAVHTVIRERGVQESDYCDDCRTYHTGACPTVRIPRPR